MYCTLESVARSLFLAFVFLLHLYVHLVPKLLPNTEEEPGAHCAFTNKYTVSLY